MGKRCNAPSAAAQTPQGEAAASVVARGVAPTAKAARIGARRAQRIAPAGESNSVVGKDGTLRRHLRFDQISTCPGEIGLTKNRLNCRAPD